MARHSFVTRILDNLFELRASKYAPASPFRRGGIERLEDRVTPTAVPFGLPDILGTGLNGGSSVIPADLDGDGDLDLAVASHGSSELGWFENLGGGTFGPFRVIDTPASVWFAYPGDLDADGDVDIVASGYSGVLGWYANDGAGNFEAVQVIDVDTATPSVAMVDFNGDGILDLLAAPDFGTDIRFYEGLGGGAYGARVTLVADIENSIGFEAHDFDGDGDIDFAYGEYRTDTIHLYLNEGGGVLAPRVTIAAGDGPGVMGYADLNGDGLGDLLSLEFDGSSLSWYQNNGDGSFGARQALPNFAGGPYARSTADVDGDGNIDILSGSFSSKSNVVWIPNLGGGSFGPAQVISQAVGQVSSVVGADFDGDGDTDVAYVSFSRGEVAVFFNRQGEFATEVIAPTTRTYLAGQTLDVAVHLGFPVTVAGSPSLALEIGDQIVQAVYASGSGTPTLTFRYTVTADDFDADGIELAGFAIALNGGSITASHGPVGLSLPGVDLSGATVNGSAPVVRSITRIGATPTNVGAASFRVVFSESVTGVDTADFAAVANSLSGVSVTAVSGSGSEFIVTLSTGTGSGTLGLSILDGASIVDGAGNTLGEGFSGGEVFTLNRRPARIIDEFYESGHGDIGIGYTDGAWDLHLHNDLGEFPHDEVLIYGGPDGLRDTPPGPLFAFIGAAPGAQSYNFPQGSTSLNVPQLGIAGEEIPGGTFASYDNSDPRVDSTGAWVRLQVVGLRAPTGGHFSIYSSGDTGPIVWVATSDGFSAADSVFILAGSHNHFNFTFTTPGIYEVDVVASGFLDSNGNGTFDEGVDRYTESAVTTYYFGIDTPGGPQPYTIPADPLPALPPTPAPTLTPVPETIAIAASVDGTIQVVHADGNTTTMTVFAGFTGSLQTATADMNGDGVADMIVAAGSGGSSHVKVIDGVTGAELRSFFAYQGFNGDVSVAVGDVTGDGIADIVTGAAGHVKVFDGVTGAEVRSFFAYQGFAAGVDVAVGDVTGDGVGDIVTGAASHVKAFDGRTSAEVRSFLAYPDFGGGISVAVGDLDGDGFADIITGAGPGGAPHVKVFSGRTGAEVASFFAYDAGFVGGVRVGAADLNGDGLADIVTGAGPGAGPHVKIFDGRSFVELDGFLASADADFNGGVYVG